MNYWKHEAEDFEWLARLKLVRCSYMSYGAESLDYGWIVALTSKFYPLAQMFGAESSSAYIELCEDRKIGSLVEVSINF
jgi:hypothetical protein